MSHLPDDGVVPSPVPHRDDDPDVVVDRPIGTRSFVYGAKTLAVAAVALLLTVASGRDFWAGFWLLLAAGCMVAPAYDFIREPRVIVAINIVIPTGMILWIAWHWAEESRRQPGLPFGGKR